MSGWIKLHRKTLENPIIMQDKEYLAVWIFLLLNATHAEYDVMFEGKRITLQKGQLITGRKTISKKLDISESKVQRILKSFENEQQIEQQTTSRNRLISILNWDAYQQIEQLNEQQVNNKRTTSEQQVNTNKNNKNIKNERIYNIPASEETSSADTAKASKHKYGKYKNVLLKDEELQTLKDEYENWEELIKYLDEYIEMKGYKAKSHYLCIKKWVVDAVTKQKPKQGNLNQNLDNWLMKRKAGKEANE